MQFGTDDLAKYTFLPEAGDYVRTQGLSVSDLASKDYRKVVERARERVVEAIQGAKVSDKTREKEIEIMSFPVSLMLVKSTKLDHLANRYALAEAVRVEIFLTRERNSKIVEDIFRDFLCIRLEHQDTSSLPEFRVPIADYTRRAEGFHKAEWKLVNRIVGGGRVYVTQHDLVRLIREEIRATIVTRLKDLKLAKVPESLEKIVQELIALTPPPRTSFSTLKVSPENYPPCVVEALRLLEKGENVPHYGRFLMATYLLKVGKTVDDIVALFPKAPDFKQNITKYQVEHIAGLKGGHTKYSVPSCRTLQTHSFCFKDPIKCYEITSPVQYPSRITPLREKFSGKDRKARTPGSSKEQENKSDRRNKQWTKPLR